MIKTILFDFGDVFLNLDKNATKIEFQKLGLSEFTDEMLEINKQYEKGTIHTKTFIDYYKNQLSRATNQQLIDSWNSILLDFPKHRLAFLEKLSASKKYQLLLLSNTNELHIDWIKQHINVYEQFKNCFDAFYLSHEINLRKPDAAIYQIILKNHKLKADQVLFIDDTNENTQAAKQLGFYIWNLDPTNEDVTELFTKFNHLL
ncbi:HAD family phosphatase [uncultured Planktosalinus sp.]|uniref:HAD family hydrolase n=1 Tax=uncultured Planktosalinus sp. TaxID=1810935 RepID=UPI0030DCC00E|tara:strand:+ start:150 stop:758 length:609 start_codon:yes stop_codon:yes gene_type:complete